MRASVEKRLAALTLITGAIPSALCLIILWLSDAPYYVLGIAAFFLLLLTVYSASHVWQQTQSQFQKLHNLLDAIVAGDYSFRIPAENRKGEFSALVESINALPNTLQKQRLRTEESLLLLRKVVDQIDVAIVAWDRDLLIRLINPKARAVLGLEAEKRFSAELPIDLPAQLDFANMLEVGHTQVRLLEFAGTRGSFRVHVERFLADGKEHRLLFMTDLSSILRSEEKRAWQNLIRVLSHEINNSLSPMLSLSDTLAKQVRKREKDPDLENELVSGLATIGARANSLSRFVGSYNHLSRVPEPKKTVAEINEVVNGVLKLFPREKIQVTGQPTSLRIDVPQIEQVLINLIKNSIEACQCSVAENGGITEPIQIDFRLCDGKIILKITDAGSGIRNKHNLFTPFYTTKANGSGIGLVFCQQVIEAHAGFLSVANRKDQSGCVVIIELPQD